MEQQQQQEESCVPPGFRFHPTEEELVGYYLARKVASQKIDLEIIQEVDLYRIEPWDLQERCKQGGERDEAEQQSSAEWYFFSFKDRKYPSGTRTNRATAAGFWKATGRDKPVVSRSRVIGMRKTLVFYRGRAPNGRKTDWIMHEYRLQTNEHAPTPEEGWVVCRAFQKPVPNQRPFVFPGTYAAPAGYYDARMHAAGDHHHHRFLDSHLLAAGAGAFFPGHAQSYFDDDLESKKHLFTIPQLESPTTTAAAAAEAAAAAGYVVAQTNQEAIQQQGQSAIDWNFLDTLLSTSQLHDSCASSFHLH